MKLIEFNESSNKVLNDYKLRITPKGAFCINSKFVIDHLHNENTISIVQDADELSSWYITSIGNIIPHYSSGHNFLFQSRDLAWEIFNSMNVNPRGSKEFFISSKPVDYEGKKYFKIIDPYSKKDSAS